MKNFFASKTVWFNVLVFAIGGFEALGSVSVLSPEILLAISTVGNFLLRFVTDKKLTFSKQ